LTRNVEWDVRRIRRVRIKSEKAGKMFAEDDVKVFAERNFHGKGLKREWSGTAEVYLLITLR
jgi:hypothetical protein